MTDTLTVSALTKMIKSNLEESFSQITIVGEISNFKSHFSGHWYFTLKDSEAQISAVMWKGLNSFVYFSPQDGMKVIVTGKITVYPPRGNYQIEVRSMKPAGIGELQLAFERLKEKLFNEGLFSEENKKPLPHIPGRIGVITSIDGAAIRDMIAVAKRKYPIIELVIMPCQVQGFEAEGSIIKAIKKLNHLKDLDVIILARGGGSIEDLWAFNEEIVAREIFKSKIPIVTGIGHEIDFTIADFVSDYRAATPTAAMDILLPDKHEIINFIFNSESENYQCVQNRIKQLSNRVEFILSSSAFRKPIELIRFFSQKLDSTIYRLNGSIIYKLQRVKNKIEVMSTVISSNNVNKTLKKGFVLVKQEDKFVKRANNFMLDRPSILKFFDGEVKIGK
jgi:exodeoxyribonuclease VII large subunit